MHPFITQHRQAIIELLARHGYTNPRVFGSMARGDADEKSDVDLLVEVPEGEDLMDFIGVKLELEDLLGRKVDLGTQLDPICAPFIEPEVRAL